MSFTWIALYEDLAARLLPYEGREPELLAFLSELKVAGLPMVRLVEFDESVALSKIDPFTFAEGVSFRFRLGIRPLADSESNQQRGRKCRKGQCRLRAS